MMATLLNALEYDCQDKINELFLDKTVSCFGIDGDGKYGQFDMARHFNITGAQVELFETYDCDFPEANVALYLDNYDASFCGHAMTDKNLAISINEILQAGGIKSSCWKWHGDDELQLPNAVVIYVDAKVLMQW